MIKKILKGTAAIIVVLIIIFFGIGLLAPDFSQTVSVEVDAPVEKAFAIFNDPDNMSKWMNNDQWEFKSIENISGGVNEVGSKWKLVFDEGGHEIEMVETVTAFEENKRFAFNVKDQFADFNLDITFKEENGKTVITEQNTEGEDLGMVSKVMITLFKGSIKETKEEMYGNLKKLIEES